MAERNLLQAKEPFGVTLPGGTPFQVAAGDTFYSDDFVVKGRENLFGEIAVRVSQPGRSTTADAETASAGPGSRRSVSRPPVAPPAGDDVKGGKSDA